MRWNSNNVHTHDRGNYFGYSIEMRWASCFGKCYIVVYYNTDKSCHPKVLLNGFLAEAPSLYLQVGDQWLEWVLSDLRWGLPVSHCALLEDAFAWTRLLCLWFAVSVTWPPQTSKQEGVPWPELWTPVGGVWLVRGKQLRQKSCCIWWTGVNSDIIHLKCVLSQTLLFLTGKSLF